VRIVQLTNDNREIQKRYHLDDPIFGPAPEALLQGFRGLGDAVVVHVVSCLQQMPRRSPEKIAENIFYHPIHVPKSGWLRTGYQGCIRATRSKIRELQPDIVHGQGTERDCALCAVFSGFPNVLTIHGVMSAICEITNSKFLTYYWFAKHLEALALRQTRGVVAISPYVGTLVSRVSRRTWPIPNALRLPFFKPLVPAPQRSGKARLINVGMVSPYKRQLELLEQLSRLRDEVEFGVTFIGNVNTNSAYGRKFMSLLQATNARHGDFAHYDSFSAEQLVDVYDASDAMLHFSSEESFGLIFAEALTRNLPLFTFDVGAIRQVSEGVPSCRIFQPNDFAALISSLRDWITTKGYLAPRENAPSRILEARYHPRVVALQHLDVYREVLAGNSRPR
jgi:glycosyltransferase involved in cell wall biosynthesis